MKNTIITLSDIDKIMDIMVNVIDPLVTYEQACKMTGKTMSGLYSKISRSNIKPICTQKMLRYSDVMKIKNKEV